MKSTMTLLFGMISICAAGSATAQEDIWTPDQCQRVATQCINNYTGYATPNECWDAIASAHCPDNPPQPPREPPFIWLPGDGTCQWWTNC